MKYGEVNLIHYALGAENEACYSEPATYKEADAQKWKCAMDDEYHSLIHNHSSILVKKPKDAKLVGCRWLFKLKEGIETIELTRYKARLFAQGFTQVEGVDYTEISQQW